jgi:hypothetical protein
MNCEQARSLLPEAADNRGTPEALAHIASCAACRDEVRLLRETWQLLAAMPGVMPPRSFLRGVQGKIHAPANRVLRFLAPLTAAAAALVVAVFSYIHAPAPTTEPVATVEAEIEKLPAEDRALFRELTKDEAWDVAEQYDVIKAVDIVGAERLGQDPLRPVEERK